MVNAKARLHLVLNAAWSCLVLGLCLPGTLWGPEKMAFFEPKVVHQVGDSFVEKS